MIPLKDTIKSRSVPYVNIAIITVNVLIFIGQLSLNEGQLTEIYYRFGVVPNWIITSLQQSADLTAIFPLITATFLHGGWLHIISNMLFLWVFGDNIEDRAGHFQYLIFYLFMGILGNVAQILVNPTSTVPIIGASGAVAGILGAYYLKFPRSRILALIPIFFFFTLMEIRASVFIIFWFILQIFNGVLSLGAVGNPVAWWAHIGGFIGGFVFIRFFVKERKMLYLE